MKKKGLSALITTLLLVGLTMIMAAIVWSIISDIAKEKMDESASCSDNFDKLNLNKKYTCYNSSGNELIFSIERKDLNIDEIIIHIGLFNSSSKKISLTETSINLPYLSNYPSKTPGVKIPSKNSGTTYILNVSAAGILDKPEFISLYPIISEKECPICDSIKEIADCSIMVT
jgi:hypothetical protein